MSRRYEVQEGRRAEVDPAGDLPGAPGRRSVVASRYPALARALGERSVGEPTIHDAATVAVEHKDAGASVDQNVASRVGAHLGADFSGVRVHDDPLAQQATAAMGARAFAYGGDVFLGAGERSDDLGLMAHELTHVVQQGAAGQRAVQRQVQVGDAGTPAEQQADQVAAAVTGGQTQPEHLLVDDLPVGPGQMLMSQFIAQLRPAVTAAADEELGPIYSAIGCPYIDQYFSRYAGQPASAGEALLRRYAPACRGARTAADMIAPVVARVREGVRTWRDTGKPPADIAAAEPAAAQAAAPATAQALRAPDGRETLASLEAELGPGQALQASTASRMSDALGVDVAGARIHTGAVAARKAAEVDALAFAVGSNVVMGAGAPAAGTLEGDALLAHELAHTAQQREAAAQPAARMQPIGAEAADAEAAADQAVVAAAAARGGRGGLVRRFAETMRTGLQLQRCPKSWAPPMPTGTLSPTNATTFATGTQVDAYLTASPTVSPYLASRIAGGESSVGHIHFHSAAEFRNAWLNYAARVNNPDTGSTYTQAEAEAWVTGGRVAAFRDGIEMHVNQESGQATDTIHESIHRYQSAAMVSAVGFNAKEGMCEYLTQKVCSEQTPALTRTPVYASQKAAVDKVAAASSPSAIANCFFTGTTSAVQTPVDAGHPNRWTQWVGFMNRATPDYTAANALFP